MGPNDASQSCSDLTLVKYAVAFLLLMFVLYQFGVFSKSEPFTERVTIAPDNDKAVAKGVAQPAPQAARPTGKLFEAAQAVAKGVAQPAPQAARPTGKLFEAAQAVAKGTVQLTPVTPMNMSAQAATEQAVAKSAAAQAAAKAAEKAILDKAQTEAESILSKANTDVQTLMSKARIQARAESEAILMKAVFKKLFS